MAKRNVRIYAAGLAVLALALQACGRDGAAPSGAGDPAFTRPQQAGDFVFACAAATDGSGDIYIGGNFTTYDRSAARRIVRLDPNGAIAVAFDSGSGFDAAVFALALAADGSGDVCVGGEFTTYQGTAANRIARLHPDGTTETAFQVGSGFDGPVRALAPAADGSGDVYVGGEFTTYQGTGANRIARLHPDGTTETAFQVGSGFDGSVQALAVAASGDVYVGGAFTTYDGAGANRIVRLNPDGTTDTAFAVGSGFDGSVQALAVAADGDLYVGGSFSTYQGTTANRIARLNPDGSIDADFAAGSGFDGSVQALALAADGSGDLYVAGDFIDYDGRRKARAIARLHPDGTSDPSFDEGFGFSGGIFALAVALDGSGDLYAGGLFDVYGPRRGRTTGTNRICRLNPDGTIDTGFAVASGMAGTVRALEDSFDQGTLHADWTVSFGNATSWTYTVSGTELTVTQVDRLDANDSAFVRLRRPLPSPATGDFHVDFDFSWSQQSKLALQALFVVLLDENQRQICRAGFLDPWKDNTGGMRVIFDPSFGPERHPTTDELPLAAGANLDVDGADGILTARWDGVTLLDAPYSATLAFIDIEFHVVGAFTESPLLKVDLVRAAGDIDTVRALGVALDGSGDIFGGFPARYNGTHVGRFGRLNPDGTLDATFHREDLSGTGFPQPGTAALAVALDGSGDVYVGGGFTTYNGAAANRIVRLNPDSTIDTSFAVGTGFNSSVRALALALDGSGDVYAGGDFTTYDGAAANRIARLNRDGTIDTAFQVGTGFDSEVRALALALDGSGDVYAGGFFTTYQGAAMNRIVRLNPEGTTDTAFQVGTGF
ncbi:MAG: hypothetical protein HY658_00950, partial [Actinobacteria bacterium]|nr:hypothetical protein [Actinomycetota bacterium]